jgi:hypothetical protein
MLALEWALRAQAAEVGARIGVAYGEAFRYVRFHPIVESLLAAQGEAQAPPSDGRSASGTT